jgi:hypothetical protein
MERKAGSNPPDELEPPTPFLRRWHVLMVHEHAVGFVLPAVYEGCSRNGLDEATTYHMGVAGRRLSINRLAASNSSTHRG